jgi:hypothetical protein
MTKNMTRKGLALGAASAMVLAGFSALPANAAGLADTSFVTLAPTTGTEYGMNALTGVTFSMTANEAATISVGNLKFLVTDTSGVINPTAAGTARAGYSIAAADTAALANSVVTVTTTTASTAGLSVGDLIKVEAADFATVVTAGLYQLTAVTTTTFSFAFTAGNAGPIDMATAVIEVAREARHATDGTYVVDSGISSAATNEVLVLAADAAGVSRSVTVQAWMDANGNDLLDSNEYASPLRTVTWTKPSEIVAVTTLSPIVGDNKLSAVITTTPVLNGNQLLVQDRVFVNAAFTRSLSTSAAVYADDTDTSNGQATTSSVWNDTNKTFTVAVNTDADAANEATDAAGAGLADTWAGLAAPVSGDTATIAISTTGVVSVVTTPDHLLVSGDKISMANATVGIALSAETASRTITVTGAKTFTYTVSETTGLPSTAIAATAAAQGDEYTLTTYAGPQGLVDRVGAETYTVKATIGGAASGNLVTTGVVSAVSATSTITTVASATVQGASFSAAATNVVLVAAGTLSVPVTVTVKNSAGDAVGAGRAVALGIASIAGSNTYKVNAKSSDTVYTDANGQVTATVTSSAGTNAAAAKLTATAENIAVADIDLTWATIAYGLVDLNTTAGTLAAGGTTVRDIIKLSSYDMDLMVADQWFNKASAGTYRLKVTGEGVTSSFVTLVDGRAKITATDTGVFGSEMLIVIVLQKSTSGVFADASTYTFDAKLSTAYKVNVGAAGNTLYGNAVVASVAVAKKALVEIDQRTLAAVMPAYANKLVLNGSVLESATNAAKVGTSVTVTGPSNVLFSDTNDVVQKRGSLTFLTGANGLFEIEAYSTSAQTDTVITFTTSTGVTGTIKVTFTGIGVGEGTSLVVTMPAAVKSASTFQVKAKLSDAYGNAVNTVAGSIKVTYTGAGIMFGTLPTETDANGELMFSILLGSNDTGSVNVTVSYDQNGDLDFVDAKDLNTSGVTAITATGVVAASSDTIVNVGTFSGKLVVYAQNAAGSKVSYKIAGKWVTQVVTSDLLMRYDRVVGATGATIKVDIYVDGVLKLAKSVVTK